MIKEITVDAIFSIWKSKLWKNRITSIDSHSAMLIQPGSHHIGNFLLPIWCFGFYLNDDLIGVNSCHLCVDGSMRSRGLWVDENFRGLGYGKLLLDTVIDKACKQDATFIWSFPRKTSWKTYESVGFKLVSDWCVSDTSDANAYCKLNLS